MMQFTLPYAVSTNVYWRNNNGRTHISEAGKKFKQTVRANYQWLNRLISGNVQMVIKLHPKLNKDGSQCKTLIDLDNCTKCVLDSLINVAYLDDRQVKRIVLEYGEPVKGGMTVVEVDRYFGAGQ